MEAIRCATLYGGQIMMRGHELGAVKEGYLADLLLVDGDPLRDISLLAAGGRHLKTIVRGGVVVKHELH